MILARKVEGQRILVAQLARERREAWDRDPGNNHPAHVLLNAQGYDAAFRAWRAASDELRRLELELAQLGVEPENDIDGEVA